jgi:hypothetical protein
MKTKKTGEFFETRYWGKGVAVVHNQATGEDTARIDIEAGRWHTLMAGTFWGHIAGLEAALAFTRECYREECSTFIETVTFELDEDGDVRVLGPDGGEVELVTKYCLRTRCPAISYACFAAARKWAGWAQ